MSQYKYMKAILVPTANELEPIFLDATVTHTNKYNRGAGIYMLHFFFSGLVQDVVFKLESNGTEYPITLNNVNLALYPGQRVKLILVQNTMIAYIDTNTGNYQYLSNNLKDALGIGISVNWVLVVIATLLLTLGLSNIYGAGTGLAMYSLLLPGLAWLYQRLYNFLLEKRMDTLIAEA